MRKLGSAWAPNGKGHAYRTRCWVNEAQLAPMLQGVLQAAVQLSCSRVLEIWSGLPYHPDGAIKPAA